MVEPFLFLPKKAQLALGCSKEATPSIIVQFTVAFYPLFKWETLKQEDNL